MQAIDLPATQFEVSESLKGTNFRMQNDFDIDRYDVTARVPRGNSDSWTEAFALETLSLFYCLRLN